MRRFFKWSLRVAAGLTGLVMVTLLATLTTVDRTSFEATSAWLQTRGRCESLRDATNVVHGELRAGFGRASMTPKLGAEADDPARGRFKAVPLAGYGAREGRPATGVRQELWVKAVAFAVAGQTSVLVGADALIVPREVADLACTRLAREHGLPRAAIYLGATHTHAGPGGWGEGLVAEAFAGPFVPGVREWFAGRIVEAAGAALADLSPAAAGGGSFLAPEFVRNRLLGDDAPEDAEFRLLSVRQADGDRGVIGSYAAHATVLPAANMEFSGDYPGAWAEAVEQGAGGLAVFVAGGMGSHGPRAGAPGAEGVSRMGRALAAQTLATLDGLAHTNRVAFGMAGVEVTLPALQVRLSDGIRLRPWLAGRLLPVSPTVLVQGLRLGDAVWLSTPCDFSGELAMELASRVAGQGTGVAVTSFNGDYVGYVIPSRYYGMGGYEPRTMSFFGPQLPDHFTAVLADLTRTLTVAGQPFPPAGAPGIAPGQRHEQVK